VGAVTSPVSLFHLLGYHTMKGIITSAIRKVTLELVYKVVDERTEEIIAKVGEVKKKQEEDFRYIIQKIDSEVGNVRGEIGQLRSEVKSEIGQLRTEVKDDIKRMDGKIDQLNQRIDTIIQMLMTIQQGQK